ncbi:MAG: sodium ion-translocating decarboxylase subunit beta [Desulfobacterales bacterium]|nr:sodium ion-translocating decarboxylase subunit beta [Desulfobacterales bacterium]
MEPAAARLEDRADRLPDRRHRDRVAAAARCGHPLVGMLMLGNLFRESGVIGRLSDTLPERHDQHRAPSSWASTVGATASAETFLHVPDDLHHPAGACGISPSARPAGSCSATLMYYTSGGKVNPLIGSAGVSAVPDGGPCLPGGGPARQPAKLPPDARHGAQRGRRHRLGRRGRRAALVIQITGCRSLAAVNREGQRDCVSPRVFCPFHRPLNMLGSWPEKPVVRVPGRQPSWSRFDRAAGRRGSHAPGQREEERGRHDRTKFSVELGGAEGRSFQNGSEDHHGVTHPGLRTRRPQGTAGHAVPDRPDGGSRPGHGGPAASGRLCDGGQIHHRQLPEPHHHRDDRNRDGNIGGNRQESAGLRNHGLRRVGADRPRETRADHCRCGPVHAEGPQALRPGEKHHQIARRRVRSGEGCVSAVSLALSLVKA